MYVLITALKTKRSKFGTSYGGATMLGLKCLNLYGVSN
jgi:hypothetical protein